MILNHKYGFAGTPSHFVCLSQATNWITNVICRRLLCSMSSGEGSSFDQFFFYIGGIVDHHCLSFFFLHNIVYHANSIITNNMHGLVICHRIRSKLISPIPLPTKGQ